MEETYHEFIRTNFRTYEEVWKIYIGNKGNDTKADIQNYPTDRDVQRQRFSEHTYTVLQSLILLYRIIEKEVFSKAYLKSTNDILDLQDNLLLFFTHLGRMRDNVQQASTCLLNHNEEEATSILNEFYHKRHILIHGKMLPIIFKPTGEILLPVLSRETTDTSGWYHKVNSWPDITTLATERVDATVNKLYWDLLPKIEEIFGNFKKNIESELNKGNYKIKFENRKFADVSRHGSGSSAPQVPSVYGIININPNKW